PGSPASPRSATMPAAAANDFTVHGSNATPPCHLTQAARRGPLEWYARAAPANQVRREVAGSVTNWQALSRSTADSLRGTPGGAVAGGVGATCAMQIHKS